MVIGARYEITGRALNFEDLNYHERLLGKTGCNSAMLYILII
jgi:hypothetical protein